MIERKFIAERVKEFQIQQYIDQTLKNVGHSSTKLVRTPLGEKIIIYASRPGLVVGKKGENIKKLTNTLKRRFNLENPQIEISEIVNPNLDAQIVAERIASTMERFGIQKFKGIAHKTVADVMNAGALGIEIRISGKVPSARAKSWRFYKGYLKKCGNVANTQVLRAQAFATLRAGAVGVQVAIMPPDIKLPDDIEVLKEMPEEKAPVKEEKPKKRTRRKKAAPKAQEQKAPEEKSESPSEKPSEEVKK